MSNESPPNLPVNHVFVDVENVKVIDPAVIGGKNLMLYLFLGLQQKRLDVELVEKLLEHAHTVQMIRSLKAGNNALDFVLAYHLGQAVLSDPKGYYHIVSRDSGYDALVELLKSRHVKVKRHEDWAALSFRVPPKTPSPEGTPEEATAPKVSTVPKAQAPAKPPATAQSAPALSPVAEKLVECLKKAPKSRPKKEKTLIAHTINFTGKDKPDAESLAIHVLTELKKAKFIAVDAKGAVTYRV